MVEHQVVPENGPKNDALSLASPLPATTFSLPLATLIGAAGRLSSVDHVEIGTQRSRPRARAQISSHTGRSRCPRPR